MQYEDAGMNMIKPAFGFWLLPLEVFGPFQPNGETLQRNGGQTGLKGLDLSAY